LDVAFVQFVLLNEIGQYDIVDVIHSLCDKLILRHPHIYSDTESDRLGASETELGADLN
jgi:uncharacterized protein YabN with tetrapyrrole methylase and pyrophosphatase domain